MPISPEIALGGKPVQVDTTHLVNLIAQGQQRRMQQESHAQQMQLGQQHIAAGELAAREAQLKMRDDQIGTEAYQKAQGHPGDTIKLMVAGGARPQAVQASEKHFADIAEQKAKTGKDQLEVEKYRNEQMLGQIGQAETMIQQNPEAFAQQWPQMFEAAKQIDPETAKHFDPSTPPTLQQIQAAKLPHLTLAHVLQQNTENRAAAKEGREVAGEARVSEMHPDQMRRLAAEAQSAEDKATGNEKIQPAEQARLDLQRRALDQTAVHNAATQANATALLKVAQGRLGLESQHAEIAKKIYDQTYGEGANPALVGVEPKLRVQASSAAQKAADEYTKAMEATGNMQSIIDLARSGNKVAYAYAPTTGVLTINTAMGVKRVNVAELKSYGGAGSAMDRVEGWLGKQATGASIPKDILEGMEQVNNSVKNGAGGTYNTKLGGINQNYRSNFQPVKLAAAQGGKITVTDPHGGTHDFPSQADADAFKKAAGIK